MNHTYLSVTLEANESNLQSMQRYENNINTKG